MAPGWPPSGSPLFPNTFGNEDDHSSGIPLLLPRLEPEDRIWLQQGATGNTAGGPAAAPADNNPIAAEPVDESPITETFRIAGDVANEKQAREKPLHERYQAQVREVESYLKKIADVSHGALTLYSFEIGNKGNRSVIREHTISIRKKPGVSLEIVLVHPLELQKSEHSKFFRPMEIRGDGDGHEWERYKGHFSMDAVQSATSEFIGRILSPEQIRALQANMAKPASPPSPV